MHFRHERVRIETARHEIEGTLQLPHEGFRSRLTDFLNAQGDDFLPLTDARSPSSTARARPSATTTSRSPPATSCWWSSSGRSTWSTSRSRLHGVSAAARRLTASSTAPGVVPTLSRA